VICLICGLIFYFATGSLPWNPFNFTPIGHFRGWVDLVRYANWIYQISLMLLIFNLLPIYPLDGGQMVQAALWPVVGHYKSMIWSCTVGMVASVLGAMVALATKNIGLAILAGFGFVTCMQRRQMTVAAGPYESDDTTDYSAAYEIEPNRKRTHSRWSIRRAAKKARRIATEERREQQQIDAILAKVSAQGMQSLTWGEKRALKKATEHQRQRDLEMGRRTR